MYDNEYFVVDMASCTSTGEIINNISIALENLNHSGKKIVLKLNDTYLNQSQLLSIQSLITSYGCILDTVETINEETWKNAENMNIIVQKPIEKRVEENYKDIDLYNQSSVSFANFSEDINNNEKETNNSNTGDIPVKDVAGDYFEADLDAIEMQQKQIDIESDLDKFKAQEIEKRLKKASNSQVEDEIDKIKSKDVIEELVSYSKMAEENTLAGLESDDDGNKLNSISVYKKAYDENSVSGNDWEDVDFYESPTDEAVVTDSKETTYINQTLRSGQILESDGNVVIIGDCHPGSEIRATGDITVWGVLSGIAHAGYKGNLEARVRALKLNAVQIRIGNCYSRRPDDTNIPYIIRSSVFTPEEARVVDNEIMLFKINQN